MNRLTSSFAVSGVLFSLFSSLCLAMPARAQGEEPKLPAAKPEVTPGKSAGGAVKAKAPASTAPDAPVVKLIAFKGAYADLPEHGFGIEQLLAGGAGETAAFYEMVKKLDELASDAEAKSCLLDVSNSFTLNMPQIAELERAIGKLRKAGKTVYAYVESGSRAQYQLACLADTVVMADMGMLDIGAPAMSVTFMKDALDLLGVQVDVVRCGDFKGAVEPFILPAMSVHLRKHYHDMLETMNQDLVRRIGERRKLDPVKVRKLQGQRMFTAKQAMEAGLVDRIVHWGGARAGLLQVLDASDVKLDDVLAKKKDKGNFNLMSMVTSMFQPKKDKEEIEEDTLVVLHLSGAIVDGQKRQPGSIVSGPVVEQVEQLAANDSVKGVVVRINSPGGSATASEAILLALKKLAQKKPVVCSMGDVAASGGYYVTCFGRPILAEEGTITGSIGVFGMKPEIGALLRRVGVRQELIALDEAGGMDSIDRPWTEDQKQQIQSFVDDVYARFVGHVAASRKLDEKQVLAIAGGRVWSGKQAVERKLVDRIGGLEDALAMVAKQAAIQDYEVTHVPAPRSFMDSFADSLMNAQALVPAASLPFLHRMGSLRTALTFLLDALTSPQPCRVWALLPVSFEMW